MERLGYQEFHGAKKKTMGGPTWSYELRVSDLFFFGGFWDGSKADGPDVR